MIQYIQFYCTYFSNKFSNFLMFDLKFQTPKMKGLLFYITVVFSLVESISVTIPSPLIPPFLENLLESEIQYVVSSSLPFTTSVLLYT